MVRLNPVPPATAVGRHRDCEARVFLETLRLALDVGEHGQHAPVVVRRRHEPELCDDAAYVRLSMVFGLSARQIAVARPPATTV